MKLSRLRGEERLFECCNGRLRIGVGEVAELGEIGEVGDPRASVAGGDLVDMRGPFAVAVVARGMRLGVAGLGVVSVGAACCSRSAFASRILVISLME